MTRGLLLLVLAAAVGVLGWNASRGEAARQRDEATQRERQRRDAGRIRTLAPVAPDAPPGKTFCVQGADGFATSVERQVSPLATGAKRLASFLALSDLAIRAERRAELRRPAPTLPRRLGLKDGEPVAPSRPACGGKGYAEL